MSHRLRLVTLAIVFFALGCTGQNIRRYYTLTNPASAEGDRSKPVLCARPLVVSFFDTVAPFDEQKIIFRTDAYEVKFYNYRLWIDSPPEMLRKLVAERLVDARLFSSVESYLESAIDHLLLSVNLLAIEERIEGQGRHAARTARLALRFQLRDPREEQLLWSYAFDARERHAGDDAKSLIEALNTLYNKELEKMLPSLAEAIGRFPGCVPAEPI